MSHLILVLLTSCAFLNALSVACNLIPLGDGLDSDPTVDLLDKDAVGLNGLCPCRDASINIIMFFLS